ncbi:MAG TPA: hypothetical protein VHW23_42625 [Kofleriaceae bacterium]|jgi:hypothetical protein|nr:hypothetical protein [Kofleriaceae bacterium]
MNTFSRVAIALVGMTGVAVAQPKADAPKPGDTKAPDMSPPAELATLAKSVAGTWHCKGQGMDHTQKMVDTSGTMTIKLDVNNWWLHGSFESKMGKESFKFESFTTYNPGTKRWSRVMVESGGNWASGESAGEKDHKVDWELTTHSPMMGDAMFRDHEDMSDPKAGAKMWGEFSPDKGKSWVKVYELACKK